MFEPTYERELPRRFVAAAVALAVAYSWVVFTTVPDWLSPSSAPFTLGSMFQGAVVLLVLTSPLITAWLLPACLVMDWVMSRRRVRHWAAVALFTVVAFGVISAPLLAAMTNEQPFSYTWVSLGSLTVQCALYLATWMAIARGGRSKVGIKGSQASDSEAKPTIDEQVTRITAETFALAGVGLWALMLTGIATLLMTFGGDGEYRLQSIERSRQAGTQACRVDYLSPGGALGDVYQQVYIVEATEAWTPTRRGLLVWHGEDVDVSRVEWSGEDHLGIHIKNNNDKSDRWHARSHFTAFPRRGFRISTVADSTR